mmetsp:Transcript_6468/g.17308  ORF Transcript_6468/g.17308 Transcript_6468/m.17308 type:complete len:111 (+) Transcript_6468:468-800(+)
MELPAFSSDKGGKSQDADDKSKGLKSHRTRGAPSSSRAIADPLTSPDLHMGNGSTSFNCALPSGMLALTCTSAAAPRSLYLSCGTLPAIITSACPSNNTRAYISSACMPA